MGYSNVNLKLEAEFLSKCSLQEKIGFLELLHLQMALVLFTLLCLKNVELDATWNISGNIQLMRLVTKSRKIFLITPILQPEKKLWFQEFMLP